MECFTSVILFGGQPLESSDEMTCLAPLWVKLTRSHAGHCWQTYRLHMGGNGIVKIRLHSLKLVHCVKKAAVDIRIDGAAPDLQHQIAEHSLGF